MASKGVTKTGEAFCMSCGASVDHGSDRCESCYSQLEQEVRAFRCPRCGKVLELGTPQCSQCSMKFKVKAVRPSDDAEDEKMLSKLIDWGKPSGGASPEPERQDAHAAPDMTPEEKAAVSTLLSELSELADLRAEVASGMGTKLSEARERISRLTGSEPSALPVQDLESELAAVSQDMASIDELLSRARQISQGVARTFSMPGPSNMVSGKTVSLTVPGDHGPSPQMTPVDLAEREEQVRKREEMVDRKIKAYAQKKKQLDSLEGGLASGPGEPAAPVEPDPRIQVLEAQLGALASKVRSLHELVSTDGACDDIEPCLSSLEEHLRALVVTRSELEQRVAQLSEGEDEIRTLLKTLDGLLGQLPSEVIDKFSNSDEFKLYERVLDRMRI